MRWKQINWSAYSLKYQVEENEFIARGHFSEAEIKTVNGRNERMVFISNKQVSTMTSS